MPLADKLAERQKEFAEQQRQVSQEGPKKLLLKGAAGMGRGGDTELAHLTPGEIVVPRDYSMPN